MVSQTITPVESLYQEELYLIPGKVLIVLAKSWPLVTDDERVVLSKMLGALKLNLATVQVLALPAFSLNDITCFGPSKILCFGVLPAEVSNLYELATVDNTMIIAAEAIDKLDDAKKKTLWLELRKMFGI